MALHVGLSHQVDAVFVAEVIPAGVVRIVTGTDGIDVEVFHYLDVLHHAADGDDVAAIGVEFVTVGTLEEHRLAVHQQLGVLDFHLAEAHTLRNGLNQIGAVQQFCDKRIEIRRLHRPLLAPCDLQLDGQCFSSAHRLRGNLLAVGIAQREAQRLTLSPCSRGHDVQHAVLVALVEVRGDEEVCDVRLRTGVEVALAGDTREAPEVLVLDVRAVAPAHHLHGDEVFLARLQVAGDIELGSHLAVLAVAHILAVDPHGEVACGRADVHIDVHALPVGRDAERAAIRARVVVAFLNIRRIGRELVAEGVAGILVDAVAIAQHFEEPWHRETVPAAVVEPLGLEALGGLVVVRGKVELPLALDGEIARRSLLAPCVVLRHLVGAGSLQGEVGGLVGEEGCAAGRTVFLIHVGVHPFGLGKGHHAHEGEARKTEDFFHRWSDF